MISFTLDLVEKFTKGYLLWVKLINTEKAINQEDIFQCNEWVKENYGYLKYEGKFNNDSYGRESSLCYEVTEETYLKAKKEIFDSIENLTPVEKAQETMENIIGLSKIVGLPETENTITLETAIKKFNKRILK
jgi:hypothetical protein